MRSLQPAFVQTFPKIIRPPKSDRLLETECQTDSREADGAPITGFVPEDVAALVTLAQKCATASDWRRNSPLLQHVSFDEVIFMEDPVTAAGKDETAFANLGYEILALGPYGPLALLRSEGENARIHLLFHPQRSTLSFRVAFPILVANLVEHARKAAGLSESAAVATGVLPVQSFGSGSSVTVRGPGKFGRTERTDDRGMVSGIPAPRAGEYRLTAGSITQTICTRSPQRFRNKSRSRERDGVRVRPIHSPTISLARMALN